MGRVIAIANQKGGVGKTTTAVNLGAYLGLVGRVLLVDLDPQGNATSMLGFNPRAVTPSTYEVLLGLAPIAEAVHPTREKGLFIVPSARSLAGAQVELVELPDRELRLRKSLAEARYDYETILIDCPPSLGLLTINALAAADGVLVPVQCEYLALEGLGQLMETIELVRQRINPRLALSGVLLTMHDPRTNLSTQVVEEVRRHFPDRTFEQVVPRSVRLSEAPSYGQSILTFAPSSPGARAYAAVAEEILRRRIGGGR
ncbi:MAG TPA: ParA family protein [Chloroflexota bacterium]